MFVRMRPSLVAAGLAVLSICCGADASPDSGLLVHTDSGPVLGFRHDGVREFRAIPYAASTAGDKRWTPPAPPEPWTEVRDATQ